MIFAFNGIQLKGIVRYNLKANDIFILKYMKDIMQRKNTMRAFKGKEVYFYISPKTLLKQMPFLHCGIRMLETRLQDYVEEKKILLRIPVVQKWKGYKIVNQYYRFPKEVFVELFSRPPTAKNCAPNYNTNN